MVEVRTRLPADGAPLRSVKFLPLRPAPEMIVFYFEPFLEAFLVNPSNLNSRIDAHEIQAAADALGQHLEVLTASTENELSNKT
jgi:hypothetical protein